MAQETETLLFPVALACITEASFFECGGIHKLYTMFVNLESLSKSSFTFGEVAEGKTDLVDSYFMLLSPIYWHYSCSNSFLPKQRWLKNKSTSPHPNEPF